jgi:hypothetical protein
MNANLGIKKDKKFLNCNKLCFNFVGMREGEHPSARNLINQINDNNANCFENNYCPINNNSKKNTTYNIEITTC